MAAGSATTSHTSASAPISWRSPRPPAVLSEQTTVAAIGRVLCVSHSRRACDTKAMVGAANSTSPPSGTKRSASRSAVKVLPVPQAITSLPRAFPCRARPS